MSQLPEMTKLANGTRMWRQNGQLHREDGPAVEYPGGSREWWINDQLHREDGPAVEYRNGRREWWIRGQELTEEEFELHRFRTWAVEGRLINTTKEPRT